MRLVERRSDDVLSLAQYLRDGSNRVEIYQALDVLFIRQNFLVNLFR